MSYKIFVNYRLIPVICSVYNWKFRRDIFGYFFNLSAKISHALRLWPTSSPRGVTTIARVVNGMHKYNF